MKRKFDTLIRYFNRKSQRENLTVLYEHRKLELSFYLNELALYKFILERQQNTRADEDHFTKKHIEARTNCFIAITNLDNLIWDLELNESENVRGYRDEWNRHSTVRLPRSMGFQYHLNSN